MFGWEFPPHNSGGLGVACRGLTRGLSDAGVSIIFVLPHVNDFIDGHMSFRFPPKEYMKERRVKSYLSAYLTAEEYGKRFGKKGGRHEREWDLFSEVDAYAKAAADIAEEEDFDVIHAHDWLAFPAGLAAKRATGKPLVLHVHLPSLDQGAQQGVDSRVYDIERRALYEADAVIAISQRVKEVLVHRYGVRSDKIHVVYNALTYEDESWGEAKISLKPENGHIALYMGRLTLHKGPDVFLRAAEIVSRFDPNFRFILAGCGELERQLIHHAASAGIGSKVFFAGFARGRERKALLEASDMLVMPSIAEPFGLVALEAAAAGVPAIVSKQSGVREMMRHMLSVDFWDVEELANKMLSLARYPALHGFMKKEGRQEAQQSTWDKAANSCISLYTACISRA